ncbi:28S ribosomal protein S10, mitochondrial [Leptopilina heterotoma]|uniref:28S ribosomal protein S10, mitochondrial n=1 Tax=Leptopilina heterotoma TaxID=63436 RepID=UPI001CA98A9D|nr:28S ribosomal protein S10, mitochondrial [Leptopilina heterotoma]
MFLPKVTIGLNNVIFGSIREVGLSRIVTSRFMSSNALYTEQAVPDKLYKKIELELRGHDKAVLKSYGEFANMTANHLGVSITRNEQLYKAVHDRYTVLKSKHVHKKHRVQYEFRTYFRLIDFEKLTGSTADTLLEYIQRNLPEGIAMKVTKTEIRVLPEIISKPPIQEVPKET